MIMSYLSKKVKQRLARQVRSDSGIEMTPDEAGEQLDLAFANIRKQMLARGHTLPDDDFELASMIKAARKTMNGEIPIGPGCEIESTPKRIDLNDLVHRSGAKCPGGQGCDCCWSGCDCGCRDACLVFRRMIYLQAVRET